MDGSSRAKYSREVKSTEAGFLTEIDAFAVGMAGVALGVGRDTAADPVEAMAGIEMLKKTGERVAAGDTLMKLWAEDETRLEAGVLRLKGSVSIGSRAPQKRGSLILEEIAPE